ncbi:hypothetical protein D3C78_1102290 [compost metagenome]
MLEDRFLFGDAVLEALNFLFKAGSSIPVALYPLHVKTLVRVVWDVPEHLCDLFPSIVDCLVQRQAIYPNDLWVLGHATTQVLSLAGQRSHLSLSFFQRTHTTRFHCRF